MRLPVTGTPSSFLMLIVIALAYGIACEKDADKQEHKCHADDANYGDRRIRLNFITAKAARNTGSSAMLGNPSGLPDPMWDMIVDALDTEFNPQLLHS